MSQTIRNGQSIRVNIQTGEKLSAVAVTGSYSITVLAGTGTGTSLATSATGGTYGPYAYSLVVQIVASAESEIDYDAGVTTSIESDTVALLKTDPLTGGVTGLVGPDGLIGPTYMFTQDTNLSETLLLGNDTLVEFDQDVTVTCLNTYQHTAIRTGNAEFSATNTSIPGVSIYCVDQQSAGTGSMRYTSGTTSLAWLAPGDSAFGSEVNISAVVSAATVAIFKLESATAGKACYVYVASATRSTQTRSVNVSSVTGAKTITWVRASNVTTVTEAAHKRRVGDFVILFNSTTVMRHGYVSAVTSSAWTIADTGANSSGSGTAYGVRNVRIKGNGATIDYNNSGQATALMSNLHACIFNAVSDLVVDGLQINNATKYAVLLSGVKNAVVSGISSYRVDSSILTGNSDTVHLLGPAISTEILNTRAQAGDNIIGIGCSDYPDYIFNVPSGGSLSILNTLVNGVISENAKEQPVRLYNANGTNFIQATEVRDVRGTYIATVDSCVAIIMDVGCVDQGQTNVDGLTVVSPDAERVDGTRSAAFVSRGAGTRRNIVLERVRPRSGNPATIKSTVSIESAVENIEIQFDKVTSFTGNAVGLLTGASVVDMYVHSQYMAAAQDGYGGFPAIVALDTATSSLNRLKLSFIGDDVSSSGQKLLGVYNQGILGKVTFDACTMLDGDSIYRSTAIATAGTVIEAINSKVTASYCFATSIVPASLELTNVSHLGGAGAMLHNDSASGTVKVKATNVVASNRFLRNVSGNTVYQINARQVEAGTVIVSDAGTPSWRIQSSCDFSIDGALIDATVANHGAGASFYNTNAAFGAGIGAYVRGATTWTRVAA